MKFKGISVYQGTFISIREDASGIAKKLPILFTTVKIAHVKKTLKDHFLNRNILPLEDSVILS